MFGINDVIFDDWSQIMSFRGLTLDEVYERRDVYGLLEYCEYFSRLTPKNQIILYRAKKNNNPEVLYAYGNGLTNSYYFRYHPHTRRWMVYTPDSSDSDDDEWYDNNTQSVSFCFCFCFFVSFQNSSVCVSLSSRNYDVITRRRIIILIHTTHSVFPPFWGPITHQMSDVFIYIYIYIYMYCVVFVLYNPFLAINNNCTYSEVFVYIYITPFCQYSGGINTTKEMASLPFPLLLRYKHKWILYVFMWICVVCIV